MRHPVGFMCVNPPCSKNGSLCRFYKIYRKRLFKGPKNICLYMIFDWGSFSFRYAVKLRDDLMFSLCCLWNRGLLCGSLSNELHLNGGILSGCKFIVMNFVL